MRRPLWMVLLIGMLLVCGLASSARAQAVCFAFPGFADVLMVTLVQVGPPDGHVAVAATWRGGHLYQLLGAGMVAPSLADTVWTMGLSLSHGTDFFAGNPSCTLVARLDATLHGGAILTCLGAAPVFRIPSTDPETPIGVIDCGMIDASRHAPRPLMGE